MNEACAARFNPPSPHKDRVAIPTLIFGFAGGPAAWTGQLLVSYGLTSYACYPGPVPRSSLLPGWHLLGVGLTILAVAMLAVTLAAFVISYRIYACTRAEMQGKMNDLLEIGEGRSRFIALCGIITSVTFAAVIVMDTVSLYLVPPCIR